MNRSIQLLAIGIAFILSSGLRPTLDNDLYAIAFEDSSIVADGKTVQCDLYYILIGNAGARKNGNIIQVVRPHSAPDKYYSTSGQFWFDPPRENLRIVWPAHSGENVGAEERGVFAKRPKSVDGKLYYTITQHTQDSSQGGKRYRVSAVDYARLPAPVRSLCFPTILSKLPLEVQRDYHRQQAASLRLFGEIAEEYFK